MDNSELAMIVGPDAGEEAGDHWEGLSRPVARWPEAWEDGAAQLHDWYEQGVRTLIVCGGDELLGRVVTAYWRHRGLGGYPLNIWPIERGENFVGEHGDATLGSKAAARKVRKGIEKWHRTQVQTLKVTPSTDAAAWYGFSFAVGWVYRAMEVKKSATEGARTLVSALGNLAADAMGDASATPVALRVAVDHEPTQASGGSMVVTTLGQTYFGLGTPDSQPRYWRGLTPKALMRRVVTPSVLDRARGSGREFSSIHLDTPQNWVLDGRLHETTGSGVVQLVPGPAVTVMRPVTGLAAAKKRLWGG